ncbi:hypothetical protein AO442_001678 [Nakaseomyces glabratus]|nr:hypothetical protein AO443_001591 [Nakaseomyces glabratus]KTB24494.1 hypothetical protein AO442_001678 [Nakaseomyces glabratus]
MSVIFCDLRLRIASVPVIESVVLFYFSNSLIRKAPFKLCYAPRCDWEYLSQPFHTRKPTFSVLWDSRAILGEETKRVARRECQGQQQEGQQQESAQQRKGLGGGCLGLCLSRCYRVYCVLCTA